MAAKRTTRKAVTDAEVRREAAELKQRLKTRPQKRTGKPGGKQLTVDLKRVDDRHKAWEMKIKGMTFSQIGRLLGCSHVHAMNLVYEHGGELIAQDKRNLPLLRAVVNERLEESHRAMVPLQHGQIAGTRQVVGKGKDAKVVVVPPDPIEVAKVQTTATQRIVNIISRFAALNGLDAPLKVTPTDPTGERRYHDMSEEELERVIAEQEKLLGLPATINVTPEESSEQ